MSVVELDINSFCFFNHEKENWRLCEVFRRNGNQYDLRTVPVGNEPNPSITINNVPLDKIRPFPSGDRSLEDADDLFRLTILEPCTIMNQIRSRYWLGRYFVNIGPITVAVNPYKSDIPLYSKDTREQYLQGAVNKPHLYAVGNNVYNRMRKGNNQCMLVSGESGAGKTYSIRVITNFLAEKSTQHADKSIQSDATALAMMQPRVGSLLEAMGNAKTRRNKDSSRFAKFAKLQFNSDGFLCGCVTEVHLLEVSRVVVHEVGERTFHIFYQMFASMQEKYKLQQTERWLFQGCTRAQWEASSDGKQLAIQQHKEVQDSFNSLKIDERIQDQIYDIVAGVMHLLCVDFTEDADNKAQYTPDDKERIDFVAHLWKVDPAELASKIITLVREMGAGKGKETTTSLLSLIEAKQKRDALCKRVYLHLFEWMTNHLNSICDKKQDHWIGMLDIFGFECFDKNSFEQFSINFANEKLQNFYSSTTSKLLDKYNAEGARPPEGLNTKPADNSAGVEAIEAIISTLDETCKLSIPNKDKTFQDNITALVKKNQSQPEIVLGRHVQKQDQFSVRHYTSDIPVFYEVAEFVNKNMSKVHADIIAVLSTSGNEILSKTPTASGNEKPLAGTFKQNMIRLLKQIDGTGTENLHWVRCIKPNIQEKADIFEGQITMKQLQCVLPLLEVARVSQDVWTPHETFWQTFQTLIPKTERTSNLSDNIHRVFKYLEDNCKKPNGQPFGRDDRPDCQYGRTQVCLTNTAMQALEFDRNRKIMSFMLLAACKFGGKARLKVKEKRGWKLMQEIEDQELTGRHSIRESESDEWKSISNTINRNLGDFKREDEIRRHVDKTKQEWTRKLDDALDGAKREAAQQKADLERQFQQQLQQAAEAKSRELNQLRSQLDDQLQRRETSLQEEINAIREELQKEKERNRQEKSKIEETKFRELSTKDQQLRDEKQRLQDELDREKQKLNDDISKLKEQIRQKEIMFQKLSNDKTAEEEAKRQLARETDRLNQQFSLERQQLEETIESLNQRLKSKDQAHQQAVIERSRDLDEAGRRSKDLERLCDQLREERDALNRELSSNKREIESLRDQNKRDIDDQQRQKKSIEETLERQKQQLMVQLEDMRKQLDEQHSLGNSTAEQQQMQIRRLQEESRREVDRVNQQYIQQEDRLRSELERDKESSLQSLRQQLQHEFGMRLQSEIDAAVEISKREQQVRFDKQLQQLEQQYKREQEAIRQQAEQKAESDSSESKHRQDADKELLKWQFQQERDQLKWQYNKAREQMEFQHKEDIENEHRRQEEVERRFQLEKKEFLDRLKQQNEEEKEALIRRLSREKEEEIEKMRTKLQQENIMLTHKIRQEGEDALRNAKQEWETTLHQETIRHQDELDRQCRDLQEQRRKEVEVAIIKGQTELTRIRSGLEWQLRQLEQNKAAEIRAAVEQALKDQEASYALTLAQKEREKNTSLQQLRQQMEQEKSIEVEQSQIIAQQLRMETKRKLDELREQCEREKSDAIARTRKDNQDSLDSLRNRLLKEKDEAVQRARKELEDVISRESIIAQEERAKAIKDAEERLVQYRQRTELLHKDDLEKLKRRHEDEKEQLRISKEQELTLMAKNHQNALQKMSQQMAPFRKMLSMLDSVDTSL